ncbi:hypothetical protein [Blastococcus saxobsidens]|uniref:Uncharacterized protein n=1 Tax=Blastococcus saxobsidens (strain DD2) TaxID=1146883 RepID=H6RPH9_BLASD|nr:hypothetical protein [Blastococcus saxobsidens]CCG04038.1 protein of unknown function [Blastococcus saxobsidens DD2]
MVPPHEADADVGEAPRAPRRPVDDSHQNREEPASLPEPMVAVHHDHAAPSGEQVVAGAQVDQAFGTRPPERPVEPAEQQITVSVRIARIEVRTPTPTLSDVAPERRTAHQPRLSLEDYLARPNRGRS